MVDLLKAIDRGIDAKEPKAWPTYGGGLLDRSKYVTASEIGMCARMVKLNKLAMAELTTGMDIGYTKTKSTDDWGFWERGHNVEAWIVEAVLAGWNDPEYTPKFLGDEQVSFVADLQSGTPDGVLVGNERFKIAEFKSIDPRTNVNRLPKLTHVDQVMQNMDLVTDQMQLSPAGGVLVYVDASNYKKRYQFPIDWDEDHAARLQARAELIMETDPKDLKPEGLFKEDCKYCAHTAVCSQMIREEKNGENYDQDLRNAATGLFG